MNQPPKKIYLVSYNIKQLATLYGMGYKTLRKWQKPNRESIGDWIGHYYNFYQVSIIF